MRVYAIRTGDYVEFRATNTKLQALVSKYVRKTKSGAVKLALTQKFYIGGDVIGVCSYREYLDNRADYNLPFLAEGSGIAKVPAKLANELISGRVRLGIV